MQLCSQAALQRPCLPFPRSAAAAGRPKPRTAALRLPARSSASEGDVPAVRPPQPAGGRGVRADLPAWLTLAAYGATLLSAGTQFQFAPTVELLHNSLAWYSIAWAGLTFITQRFEFDAVGSVVGPAYLAVQALGGFGLNRLAVASAAFGLLLARDLPGPTLAWLPTLAAAVYYGYSAHWVVAAFGAGAAWRLVAGAREGRPPVPQLAFVGLAAWSLYAGHALPVALCIFAGRILASAIT